MPRVSGTLIWCVKSSRVIKAISLRCFPFEVCGKIISLATILQFSDVYIIQSVLPFDDVWATFFLQYLETAVIFTHLMSLVKILLAVIVHSVVKSSTRTLFTMLFCSETPQQCFTQQDSFSNLEAIFGDNC